ncbi:MAG: sigma-70 family RNA polymerase sigma factor [Lachnospiraceae bacterium]|nr:sigma-70 family RNA polymerase sigma factor [Lachnospiraceae bacterium]
MYRMYQNLMVSIAYQVLNNRADAEDAVQESWIKILRIAERIGEPESSSARNLAAIVTKRTAIDFYRRNRRTAVIPLDEAYMETPYPDPSETVPEKCTLADAMAALPPVYRDLLLLHYDQGLAPAEIAPLMSMTEANVRKTMQRARKKLESELERIQQS